MFALDERLASIVAATVEPTIGLIRLAWWREAIEALGAAPVPAEPLLAALADTLPSWAVDFAVVAGIEDGWAPLIEGDLDSAAIARHARERGGNLFAAAATLLGARDEGLALAGAGWALADLAHRHSEPAVRVEAGAQASLALAPLAGRRWSRPARPLAMLAVLARRDVATPIRRQAAPGRVLRMLALQVTGR